MTDKGREIHVIPQNAGEAHDLAETCPCGPSVEIAASGDGRRRLLITHRSPVGGDT